MANEPLSEPTRKMRRAMIGTSVSATLVCVLDVKIERLPITSIGLEVSVAEDILPIILLTGIIWFAVSFGFYLADDLLDKMDDRVLSAQKAGLEQMKSEYFEKVRNELIDGPVWQLKVDDPLVRLASQNIPKVTIEGLDNNTLVLEQLKQNIRSRASQLAETREDKAITASAEKLVKMLDALARKIRRSSSKVRLRNPLTLPGWRLVVVDIVLPIIIALVGLGFSGYEIADRYHWFSAKQEVPLASPSEDGNAALGMDKIDVWRFATT